MDAEGSGYSAQGQGGRSVHADRVDFVCLAAAALRRQSIEAEEADAEVEGGLAGVEVFEGDAVEFGKSGAGDQMGIFRLIPAKFFFFCLPRFSVSPPCLPGIIPA